MVIRIKMVHQFIASKLHKFTIHDLMNFMDENDIDNPVDRKDLHVTIILSDTQLRQKVSLCEDADPTRTAKIVGFEKWKTVNGSFIVVAVLECEYLQQRHKYFREQGKASHRFDTYSPHITLSYDVDPEFDVSSLQWDPEVPIILTTEYTQELKTYE